MASRTLSAIPEWYAAPSHVILDHRGKALSALQETLSGPGSSTNDEVIMSILWLSILDYRMSDIKAHDIHKRYLRRLIWQRGGMKNISGLLSFNLSQFDFFWKEKPARKASALQPLSGPPKAPPEPSNPRLPYLQHICEQLSGGFQELAWESKLSMTNG